MRKEVFCPHESKPLSSTQPFLSHLLSSPPITQNPGYVTIYPELFKAWPEPCKHSIPGITLLNQSEWWQSFQNPIKITDYSPVWEHTVLSALEMLPQDCQTIKPWWTDVITNKNSIVIPTVLPMHFIHPTKERQKAHHMVGSPVIGRLPPFINYGGFYK